MAEIIEDDAAGMYTRHPVRTVAGLAFLVGTAAGLGIMAAKQQHQKSWIEKLYNDWVK